MSALKTPPVIVDPCSRLGDEIAGDTADQVALNFLAVVKSNRLLGRFSIRYHPIPDLRQAFKGCALNEPAKRALREVEAHFGGSKGRRK